MHRMLDPASYAANVYALPLVVTCVLLFGMGVFVLAKRRTAVHVAFAVLVASAFVWLSGHVFLNLTIDPAVALGWSRYKYLGVTTLGANFCLFILAYVGRLRAQRRLLIGCYGLSAIFLVLAWLPAESPVALIIGVRRFYWGYYAQLSPVLGPIYLSMFVLQSAAAFYHVVAARMACRDPGERKRNALLLASFAGAYVASIDFLPCFGVSVYPAGYLFVTLFLALFAYSIVRYHLLDIATVIHRTAIWILTSLLVLLPLVGGLLWAAPWLHGLSGVQFVTIHLVLLTLMFLYMLQVQPRIDQLVQRRQYDIRRVVERFQEEIRDLRELVPLARHIVSTVERVLVPEHAALFLVASDGSSYLDPLMIGGRPNPACGPEQLRPPAAALRWLVQHSEVVDRDRLGESSANDAGAAAVCAYLDDVQTQVMVPLVQRGMLLGTLHIGRRRGGRPYTLCDLRLLARLRSAASIALANSLLYREVQELNRRLTESNAQLEHSNRILQARNEELQETRTHLVQSSRLAAIGEMAAKLTHELGNPIGIISGSVQFCLESLPLGPEVRQHLQVIDRNAQSAGRIVRGLLHLAHPAPAEVEAVVLPEVVEAVTTLLNGRCARRRICIETDLGTDLPAISIAREHLEQVLLNVLLNALEFAPDDGRIRIGAHYDAAGSAVVLSITDNGPGILPEHLEHVFEPFFTMRPGGTGLGLSICRDMVGLYNGTIHAERVDQGTRFAIRFAARRTDVAKSCERLEAKPHLH